MGVTLERVQNKFACIIGELCSEPDILSQFAIWVDLRIAEYKANGYISLDCSGENPNPTWLRGFIPPPPTCISRERRRRSHDIPGRDHRHRSGTHRTASQTVEVSWDDEQNSPIEISEPPYITVIKEEKADVQEVHPVGIIHTNSSRKRAGHADSDLSPSPSPITKVQRTDCSATSNNRLSGTVLEPVHESLMSIIGGGDTEDGSNDDDRAITISTYTDSTAPDRADSVGSRNISVTLPSPSDKMPSQAREDNSTSSHAATDATDKEDDTLRQKILDCINVDDELQYLYPTAFPSRLSKENVRRRVESVGLPKTQQTIVNMVTIVCRLERWWWLKYNERRQVERMSAEELDAYLAEFFTILVRPDGQEFDVCHLSKARSNLDRFLRECGYPYSISKSDKFIESQMVVKNKRQILQQKPFLDESHTV